MKHFIVSAAIVFAYGCNGVRSHLGGSDARREADASADADASPVAPAVHQYVINAETFPGTSEEADQFALDLDGTGRRNKFGAFIASLTKQGFSPQAAANHAINAASVLVLGELVGDDLVAGHATFTLFTGTNPSPAPCVLIYELICGQHLAGTGTFDIARTSPNFQPLAGTFSDGVLVTDPGSPQGPPETWPVLELDTSLGESVTYKLLGARVFIKGATDAGVDGGVIAGGVTAQELDGSIPALASAMQEQVVSDCAKGTNRPCGCIAESSGEKLLERFDDLNACALTADGLRRNTEITSLLQPDIMFGTTPLVSLGIGFTAVKGTFSHRRRGSSPSR